MSGPSPDELREQIARQRAEREESARQVESTRRLVEAEGVPLWTRIQRRRRLNGFGSDYDLALTPRRAS